jgi:oxygen-dependent protoporphyrinogen oxidase
MPWDGIYALATPRRSFSMLFNTTNAVRGPGGTRAPGGSLMVYAAADLARGLARQSDSEIERRFLADLDAVFPPARRVVDEVVIRRWEQGLPYPRPGRAALQPALMRPQRRIHLAGDYLGMSYTDTAAWTAEVAARRARATIAAAA